MSWQKISQHLYIYRRSKTSLTICLWIWFWATVSGALMAQLPRVPHLRLAFTSAELPTQHHNTWRLTRQLIAGWKAIVYVISKPAMKTVLPNERLEPVLWGNDLEYRWRAMAKYRAQSAHQSDATKTCILKVRIRLESRKLVLYLEAPNLSLYHNPWGIMNGVSSGAKITASRSYVVPRSPLASHNINPLNIRLRDHQATETTIHLVPN